MVIATMNMQNILSLVKAAYHGFQRICKEIA